MYKRVLSYRLPADALMLQLLNATNGTRFESWQLTFGEPTALIDERPSITPIRTNDYDLQRPTSGTLTKIEIKPTPASGWKKSQWLTYRRRVIQDSFVSVPFVIYACERDKASVLRQLLEQYGLFLDDHLCDIRFEKVSLSQTLFKRHLGSVVENEGCGDYTPPISWNAIISIRPEHPFWQGEISVYIREAFQFLDRDIKSTLQIGRHLGPEKHDKIPAEMVLRMDRYVDSDYVIRELKAGDLVDKGILQHAQSLTQDPWIFEDRNAPFNLYGTKVVHNGPNTGDIYINDPKVTDVLILEFSDDYCRNITGQWVFSYYNQQSWLKRQRIDALPIQDM